MSLLSHPIFANGPKTMATDLARMNVLQSSAAMGEDSTYEAPSSRASGKVRIASPRFLAFLTAQALGAANDNALRITLVLFLISVVSGEARQVRYSEPGDGAIPDTFPAIFTSRRISVRSIRKASGSAMDQMS